MWLNYSSVLKMDQAIGYWQNRRWRVFNSDLLVHHHFVGTFREKERKREVTEHQWDNASERLSVQLRLISLAKVSAFSHEWWWLYQKINLWIILVELPAGVPTHLTSSVLLNHFQCALFVFSPWGTLWKDNRFIRWDTVNYWLLNIEPGKLHGTCAEVQINITH